MNCLCALLLHDDDNVLVSPIKVVLKGHSDAIPNDPITMNIQGFSHLLPYTKLWLLKYGLKTFQKVTLA